MEQRMRFRTGRVQLSSNAGVSVQILERLDVALNLRGRCVVADAFGPAQ
jgi:hypothetical protein